MDYIGGGQGSPMLNIIDFITIASTGNAQDFGDLTQSATTRCINNSTRGCFVVVVLMP